MAAPLPHHYAALGLASDASVDAVRQAYREAVQRWHPDAQRRQGRVADAHTERMTAIAEAHEVLSDPTRRATYDKLLWAGVDAALRAAARGPVAGLVDRMIGVRKLGDGAGRNRRMKVAVSLAEAVRGTQTSVQLDIEEGCADCDGAGFGADGRPMVCEACGALGEVLSPGALRSSWESCRPCHGRGWSSQPPCRGCGGRGARLEPQRLAVPIPAGTPTGRTLRIKGAGEPGDHGGPPGDLLVDVSVSPDPELTLDGDDVRCERAIPFWLAVAGGPVQIRTAHGPVRVQVPAHTRSGEVLRLPGWGVRRAEGAGDQLVTLRVEWPTALRPAEREALAAWGRNLGPGAFAESERAEARAARTEGPDA